MGIKGGHEDERDIDTLGCVEVLDLADGKVEECHVVFDLERALRASHTCKGSSSDGTLQGKADAYPWRYRGHH